MQPLYTLLMQQGFILHPGKEKIIYQRHHWIFSGAIASFPNNFIEGDLAPVFSSKKELLGHGYFNRKASLSGRMISFGDIDPKKALLQNVDNAIALRTSLFPKSETAYRLIHGEGDFLPGLIVDKYDDILVIQIATLGMDR